MRRDKGHIGRQSWMKLGWPAKRNTDTHTAVLQTDRTTGCFGANRGRGKTRVGDRVTIPGDTGVQSHQDRRGRGRGGDENCR